MFDYGSLNPLAKLGPELAKQSLAKTNQTGEVDKQFVKMFVNEVLKETFKSASSIGQLQSGQNQMLSGMDPSMFSEVIAEELGEELIASGAFNVNQVLAGSNSAEWKQIIAESRRAWLK